jgi:hypothetical protein
LWAQRAGLGEGGGEVEGEGGFAGAGVGGEERDAAAGEMGEPEVADFAWGDLGEWDWVVAGTDHESPPCFAVIWLIAFSRSMGGYDAYPPWNPKYLT